MCITDLQCIQKDLRYVGHKVGKLSTESAEECACACKNEDMCSFFTWTKKKKKCIMKSAIGKRKKKKGAYSGSVDCCKTQGIYLSRCLSINKIKSITTNANLQ